ncbi:MAG: signal recognition particle-docking protein FtsY [Alphaproteobacteria bacterium]
MSWFKRLSQGLSKTSKKATGLLTGRKIDATSLAELEDELIMADLGYEVATDFCEKLRQSRFNQEVTSNELKMLLAEEITQILEPVAKPLTIKDHKPFIIMMVGVNGSGKTTTVAKLGQKWKNEGYSQLWVAADTFRAAAVEQLQVWAERLNIPLMKGQEKSDAASLAFEAIEKAKKEQIDIVIIDTAGRLQNKTHLMDELAKVERVVKKQDETAPHETLLVLDATVGQNAISQVELFQKAAPISGLIMTKLDGTAKGGVLVSIARRLKLPIYAIGVGESHDDLHSFEPLDFAKAMLDIKES